MARYIDAELFRGKHEVAEVNGKLNSVILYADIVNAPTADVVPRAMIAEIFEEIDKLAYRFMNDKHYIFGDMVYDLAELKKKYTEEGK